MKISKLALVSIVLLAILTLGAVSASDDADALAVSDDGDIVDVSVDENEAVALDSDDVVGDGSEEKYNATINVNRPEEVYFEKEMSYSFYGSVDSADGECEYYPEGDVILYLNDEEFATGDADWFNFDVYFDEFKEYNFRVEYSGDENFNPANITFTYNLTNSMYKISVSEDIKYGKDSFSVYSPVNDPSAIEITVNGKKFKVYQDDDWDDEYICNASALNYGLNTVKIYYPGDEDFGEYSGEANITVLSYIDIVESTIELGDSAEFYVELPADATGKLTVFSRYEYYDDEAEKYYYVNTEIASADAKDGVARVLLGGLSVGSHVFYANFTGSVEVREVGYWIDVKPIVKVPKTMITGGDDCVVVETSKDATDLVEVSYLKDPDYDFDDEMEYTFLASANAENGQAKIPLSGLDEGFYSILVQYNYDENSFGRTFNLYVVDEYDVNVNISYYNDNVIAGYEGSAEYEIASYADGNITIIVDGKVVDTWDVGEERNYFYFNTTGLSVGEHTLTVNFTSETQGTSSDEVKFNIVSATIYIPNEMNVNGRYVSANHILVNVNDMAVGTIRILIDGKEYLTEDVNTVITEEFSYVYSLSDVSRGKHNVTVTYSDDKYGEVSKSETVNFGYDIIIIEEYRYGVDNIITVTLPKDIGNGDLTITLDGNKIDFVRNSSEMKFNPSKLSIGNHTVIVKYAGDDFYPASEVNDTFEVLSSIDYAYRDMLMGSDNGVSLILPGDAKGKLNVTVFVEIDDDEGWHMDVYDSQLVSFADGKAYYSFASLPQAYYYVEASYTGDDYEVYGESWYFEVTDIDFGDDYIDLGENKTIQFVSPDDEPAQLRVVFSKLVDNDKDWDDPVNLVKEFYVPLENGKATYTFSNLQIGAYHIFLTLDDMDGNFLGFQSGSTFYVESPYVSAQTGTFEIGNIPAMEISLPKDANGKVNVIVYENYTKETPDIYKTAEITVNGPTTIDLNTIIKDTGKFNVLINYTGNYGTFQNDYYIYKITDVAKLSPGLQITADDINVGEDVTIIVSLNQTITGEVTVTVGGTPYTVDVVKGTGSKTISNLAAGSYDVTASYAGDDVFRKAQKTASFTVNKLSPRITINSLDRVVEGSNLTVTVVIPSATGSVIVNGKEYDLTEGKADATITNVETGVMTISVSYSGDNNYLASSANKTVTVYASNDPNLQITVDDISAGESAVVNVVINEAVTGEVTVNGTAVTITNGKGSVSLSNLAVGQYTVTAVFAGDEKFIKSNATASFKVNKAKLSSDVISAPGEAKTPTFAIAAPADATGSLRVIIGGKSYTAQLADGSASIVISDLSLGSYEATITYSGDAKYDVLTKNVTVSVITDPKITAKATSVLYTANGKFQVTVYGKDGKLASGVEVIFKIAGKQVGKATTNANGVATYTVKNVPGTYTVSATALAKTASAKLTVKHLVTLKSVTVKKSAKKLVLQATLSKVNGKYLKNKQIIFKFNGKTYKAKTSSKGVAKVTIKSTVINKLKVGKKITYQATYLKDTVKKTVKVKK